MLHQHQAYLLNDLEHQELLQSEECARGELDEQQELEPRREERRPQRLASVLHFPVSYWYGLFF